MCYLCFIYIFLVDPECFKIKTKVDTASDITAPLTQSNGSNNKTSSNALYINTTADTTSDLQHGIINGNKIEHGTDPTSVNTYQTTHPQSVLYQDWSQYVYRFVISMFLRKGNLQLIKLWLFLHYINLKEEVYIDIYSKIVGFYVHIKSQCVAEDIISKQILRIFI